MHALQTPLRPPRPGPVVLSMLLAAAACARPEPPPLPPHHFAFGVFGDGPYTSTDARKFRRLLADVSNADIEWLLHVGDLLWFPCSDAEYRSRLAALNTIPHPVVYTPGDNEWLDCHERRPGGYDPLDRLASLRRIFFGDPSRSIGGEPMPLETQGSDAPFAANIENARWRRGGFVFATMHMVGGGNGTDSFPGWSAANAGEASQRTGAAIAWMNAAFDIARRDAAHGVVLAVHGNPGLERAPTAWNGYEAFVEELARQSSAFTGQVLLIHGDTHTWRVDQPLTGPAGTPLANFTRLETFGSPDIGWVRVVIDSISGRITAYEPRLSSVFR